MPTASARSSEWKNGKGETFNAEPAEVLGPWALFDDGTLVPLNMLSDEDCVRFYQGLKDQPVRAADWKDATSKISRELYGRLMRYEGDNLVVANESGRPEPEFFTIFFTSNDRVESWDILSRSTPELYSKLVKDYPGLVQGVVFGFTEETLQDFMDVATNTKGEWLYTQFIEEKQMRNLQKLMPTNIYGIVVMTRDGIPLFGPDSKTDEQVKAIFENFSGLLGHMRPEDMRVWIARAHYFRAIQPVAYANGKCDPLLVGNPLLESKLRQLKVYKLDATFQVGADGKVKSVDVVPGDMTPSMVSMFRTGFQRGSLFVPAVDHGKFVDGTYAFHMGISP